MNMDFDNTLKDIGEFGRYQKKVYFLLGSMSMFHCGQILLLVFVADKPTWSCTSSAEQSLIDPAESHPCYKNGSTCKHVQFSGEFTSIATEWNLICDQDFKANFAQSFMMAGCLIGVLISGRVSDRLGRKCVAVYSQVFGFTFGLLTAFAQTYTQFLIARFLCGLSLMGAGLSIFVLISEIIGPTYRGPLLTLCQIPFSLGFVLLASLAYVFREWRHLCIATSVPGLLYILFCLNKFHESPRWLLANGQFTEAEEILQKIATTNGHKRYNFEKLKETKSNSSKESHGLSSLFTYNSIRMKIIPLTFMWLVCSMVYYGLSLNVTNIKGNKYWNFILLGLVEIPSNILATPLINSLGRRMSMFLSVIISGISCILVAIGPTVLQTILAMLGKFGISATFTLIYVYSGELMPTIIRTSALGYCSMTARVGGILAPMIVALAAVDQKLPMLIFGLSAVASAIIGLGLPETKNNPVGEIPEEDDIGPSKTTVSM